MVLYEVHLVAAVRTCNSTLKWDLKRWCLWIWRLLQDSVISLPVTWCKICWGPHSSVFDDLIVFWDLIPLKISRRFGEIFGFHLACRRISWPELLASCLLVTTLTFRSWGWKQHMPPKLRLTLCGLRGIILFRSVNDYQRFGLMWRLHFQGQN